MNIFLSYPRKDKTLATGLKDILYKGGHTVWIDDMLTTGRAWRDQLEAEINKADAIALALTPNWIASPYCQWEFITAVENGKKYFSVASGGGTGRTLHPDNMAAGPASYGLTDSMGRMHGDAQFAGSSSVPAHVEMMGLIGAGNNPMVGMTVACAVAVEEASK